MQYKEYKKSSGAEPASSPKKNPHHHLNNNLASAAGSLHQSCFVNNMNMNHPAPSRFHRASSDQNEKKVDLRRLISGGGGGGPQASTRVTYIDLCSNPVSSNAVIQTGGRSPGTSAMVTNLMHI